MVTQSEMAEPQYLLRYPRPRVLYPAETPKRFWDDAAKVPREGTEHPVVHLPNM